MKGNIRILAALLTISGMIGLFATYKAAAILLSGPTYKKPIQYQFDSKISLQSQSHIKDYIEQHRALRSQVLINSVCNEFEHIKHAYMQHNPQAIDMHIVAHDVCALVNNKHAMTPQGTLLDKEHFSHEMLDELKHIDVHDLEVSPASTQSRSYKQLPYAIHRWVMHMPQHLFKNFFVTWIHENQIECCSKQDPHLVIRCTAQQDITPSTIDACMHTKNQIQTKPERIMVADIRFDRQIIISRK